MPFSTPIYSLLPNEIVEAILQEFDGRDLSNYFRSERRVWGFFCDRKFWMNKLEKHHWCDQTHGKSSSSYPHVASGKSCGIFTFLERFGGGGRLWCTMKSVN
jgi:hypothetical protein